MGVEIERKFLLRDERWRAQVATSSTLLQGYLVGAGAIAAGQARCAVRVRVADRAAWLTVKAAQAGIERAEYEYAIPPAAARRMLADLCLGRVEKVRHRLPLGAHVFEIDEFGGANQGLVLAEVELTRVDETFPHPPWLGREVSHLRRYYNVELAQRPWSCWTAAERAGQDLS